MSTLIITNETIGLTAQDEIKAIVDGDEVIVFDIDDIRNVSINGLADNDILAYDTTTSKWKNQDPGELGFATVATSGDYDDLTNKPALNRTTGYASTSLPTGTTGDIIHITDNNNKPAYYNGTAWKYFSDDTDV